MSWKPSIGVLFLSILAFSRPAAAEGQQVAATQPPTQTEDHQSFFLDDAPRADHEPIFLARGQSGLRSDLALRLGLWGVDTDGNLLKIGEYQGLQSSAFFDVDGLCTDGQRTADLTITGTEDEDTAFHMYWYGSYLTADVDYRRFPHRLDHDPLTAFLDTPDSPQFAGEDLNAGKDYAIRVQEFDSSFKGQVTENIQWRLNVWGMHKKGHRQANALNHNCSGRQCHLLSQAQNIDWMTMEIEPVIEVKYGPVSAEYSRTMRSFEQSDEPVTRSYNGFPVEFIDPTQQFTYAYVPENFTQIDRLKIRGDITCNTHAYAVLFAGDTKNRDRLTHRDFDGYDLRLVDDSIDGLQLVGTYKQFNEDNQLPPTFPEDDDYPEGSKPSEEVRHPVDREWTKAGIKGRWRPCESGFDVSRGLAFGAGYEYRQIDRQFATYPLPNIDAEFTQPTTISNLMHVETSMRWSNCLDTYIRYKMLNTDNPLLGVREADASIDDPDLEFPSPPDLTALNSNQPEHRDFIELGGTWTPAYNFMLSAYLGVDLKTNHSAAVDFDEDNYPIVLTAWYAPTCRLSFAGGAAYYTNWIDQDITFGNRNGPEPQDTQPVDYRGRAQVYNLGTTYLWTDRLTLTGGVEWVRGSNTFFVPSPENADWTELPTFSDVIVETTRLSFGVDYCYREGITCYVRYNYYDWRDRAGTNESGTANMVLGGVTALF
ncbi:MAG TPA: hypothetical protein VMY42_23495 [Thermoguttaceae bacterium]|nr:hypothetical protein [Thermoguttaceae bacterium]